jgi:hypothetical protein
MAKLPISPERASYTAQDGQEFIRVQLDGGRGFYRKTKEKATARVQVQWALREIEYAVLRAFFRNETLRGSTTFTMDLILEDNELAELTCNFIAPPSLSGISGDVYYVSAELEVTPPAENTEADDSLLMMYGLYGDGLEAWLNIFARLTNETMAATLYE